jgi:hypothetical protein
MDKPKRMPYGEEWLRQAFDSCGTRFALVRVPGQLDDLYLDESDFDSTDRRVFDYTPDGDDLNRLPDPAVDALDVYRSLPTLSETFIVDLGLSTHVLPWTLYLGEGGDETTTSAASVTTVQSTFSFSFDPHPACDTTLQHHSGQVEVDAGVNIEISRPVQCAVVVVVEVALQSIVNNFRHRFDCVCGVLGVSCCLSIRILVGESSTYTAQYCVLSKKVL